MKYSNKKTYILSILTASLLFTGCAVQNGVTPDSSSKTHNIQTISKKDLIQKAENLDLDAMIKLAHDYEYQYTKEGLVNFEKWYTKLDKNQNGEKLTQLAKVYGDSDHIFTNPILKTSNIYKLAEQAGNKNAKIDLITFYLEKYRSLKAKEVHNEFIKTASTEQLIELLDLYTKKRRNTLREEVAKKLSADEQLKSVEYVVYQLKRYSYKKPEVEKKKEDITKKLLESNDLELLSKVAKALNNYSNKKISYKLYNEILKIDSNNTEAQYQLAKIYQRGSYYGKIKRDKVKALDYFQKASKGGNLESKMELLKTFTHKKEDLDIYIELKKDIEKTTEGQLALADYFFNISDSYSANKILSKLSAQGNIDSKIKQILVAKTNYRYKRNPEFTVLANKLQDEILKGNNELHKKKLIDTMSSRKYSRTFQDDLKKYYEANPKKMNIKDIRPLTKGYKVPKEERLKWTNKLIDMGDIHTTYSLANDYRSTYGLVGRDYKKRKELLEILSKKGHHAATISLAREYMYPNKKADKDVEKGLSLYEKVANEGSIDAQEFLEIGRASCRERVCMFV